MYQILRVRHPEIEKGHKRRLYIDELGAIECPEDLKKIIKLKKKLIGHNRRLYVDELGANECPEDLVSKETYDCQKRPNTRPF